MKRRTFLAIAAALAAATSLPGSAQATTRIRFAHVCVTDTPDHVTALAFADKLKKAAGGEVEVTIVPNSQLGGAVDVVEAPFAEPYMGRSFCLTPTGSLPSSIELSAAMSSTSTSETRLGPPPMHGSGRLQLE